MHLLKPLWQLIHWGPILALSVIFYITVMSYHCIRMWWPPWQTLPSTVHALIYFFWLFSILYNFFMAAFLGPGFVESGWSPENSEDKAKLQYCEICRGYKVARSHHCRKCGRCCMKMDHHCPWINTCCGHRNHTRFMYFLIFCILGCLHASVALACSMYDALYSPYRYYQYHRDSARMDNTTMVFLGVYGFIGSLFAFGLAVGVIISVSVLLYIQLKVALTNRTGIEQWIELKAKHRHDSLGTIFTYPYDLGWKQNLKQVFNWSGCPVGDGINWRILPSCTQYDLTIEQLAQKSIKRNAASECKVVRLYHGSWFPVTFGVCTCVRIPISDEHRMALCLGEHISVTRYKKYWLYGTKQDGKKGGLAEKGWFPRTCVIEIVENEEEVESHADQKQKIKTS